MNRFHWTGVMLGVVTVGVLAGVLLAFVGLVLGPQLSVLTGTEPINGVTSVTVTEERIYGLLVSVSVILAVLLSFFVGGLIAGRFALSYAGFNGAATGIIVAVVPLLWLLISIASVLGLVGGGGDIQGRSENLGMLGAAIVVYFILSPVVVLVGFWGGRIGGRLGGVTFEENNGSSA